MSEERRGINYIDPVALRCSLQGGIEVDGSEMRRWHNSGMIG